jgi:hypothetical protein
MKNMMKICGLFGLIFLVHPLFSKNPANEWKPKWKIGDWWIVKSQSRVNVSSVPRPNGYDPFKDRPGEARYEVIGIEKIKGQNNYVLEKRPSPIDSCMPEFRTNFYLRKDDFWPTMEVNYSYRQSTLPKTDTFHYRYFKKCPLIFDRSIGDFMPVFPLIFEGAAAESLAEVHLTHAGYVAQKVNVRRLEDFTTSFKNLENIDTIHMRNGVCYLVTIEQWRVPRFLTDPSSEKRVEVRQIWVPSLPWYLYQEIIGKTVDRRDTLIERCWLADYSGWHK